jgi:TrpR-related protein YerC/YecD
MIPLNAAILSLKTPQEAENFLRDLCTPGELKDFAERWAVAQTLATSGLPYRAVATQTGASLTTVTRVARFLKDEPYQGYQLIIKRLAKKFGLNNAAAKVAHHHA